MNDGHAFPRATTTELAPRQLAVVKLVFECWGDKQIAARLGITPRRVAYHVEAIAYLIHADPSRDVRRQIALWWREQTCDIRRDEDAA